MPVARPVQRAPIVERRRPAAAPAVQRSAVPATSPAQSLQLRLGNQGAQALVARLIATPPRDGDSVAPLAVTSQPASAIQLSAAGRPPTQISHPDDPAEKEAEETAKKVMRMGEPSSTRLDAQPKVGTSAQRVHRSASTEEDRQVSAPVAASIHDMQGGGAPLPAATRARFEPRFDADFNQVRVHTGIRADSTAKAISAKAFTVGPNIAFASGQYSPESHEGQHLLAHELTHVVQQQGGRLQRSVVSREPEKDSVSAEELIVAHMFDIEGLGRDLARRLPGASALTIRVINALGNSGRDDLCEEIVTALGTRLSSVDEPLRMIFVRELLDGVVTDDQEGKVRDVWVSFKEDMPKAAERNRDRWRKSLWESDQLCEEIRPVTLAFGGDVIGVAKAYLEENRRVLGSEALQYGFDLDGKASVEPTNPDYLNQIRELVPQLVLLHKQLDALKALQVGYRKETIFSSVNDEMGQEIEMPVSFDPDRRPASGPKGTEQPPWPTWADTNTQYQRISAVISAFASQYPSVYILMQQGKLEVLEQAQDASKARDVIYGAMAKTQEKIDESTQKLDAGRISYYDLKLIQTQLLTGDVQAGYVLRYPWNEPFFQDIANDDIKGHEAHQFWIDLGLSLLAAAALIAAPFTGGASAAFLVGFGIGIGVGQAGMSWDKYLKLSTMSDANVSEELTLVAKGEVTAALVEAIVNTVAVFLDVYGARGAMRGATQAVKVAEKQLAKTAADEASKKAVRGAMKESAMVLGGSALAIGMHELDDDDQPVPELAGSAAEWEIPLGPDTPDTDSDDSLWPTVNRVFIFRIPGPGGGSGGAAGAASSLPATIVTGADFELHIEKALLQGKVGNLPQMSFVLPGQYNPQGWGIDRIGIVFDANTGKVQVFHLEMKWVSPGSTFTPGLGTPKVGTQTGGAWTRKAVDGFLNSKHQVARNARRRLKNFLKKINPGKTVDDAFMTAFLHTELTKAPVRVVVPHWADFSRLYKQIAALSRLRKIKLTKIH